MSSENISATKSEKWENPIVKWQRETKNKLLESVPSGREGLNLERVQNFLKDRGLTIKDTLIFDRSDLSKISENLKGSGLDASLTEDWNESGYRGSYIPELDMVIMERSPEREELNGTIYTEGVLVHEQAHASSLYNGLVIKIEKGTAQIYAPRLGFGLQNSEIPWGFFLEEGFADMTRGDYVERFSREDGKSFEKITAAREQGDRTVSLPQKYYFRSSEGKAITAVAALAGFGLELLCDREPRLKEMLIAARRDIRELRKIPKIINRIEPGLYGRLQHLDYNKTDFASGLNLILEITKR